MPPRTKSNAARTLRTAQSHTVGTTKKFRQATLEELTNTIPGQMFWVKSSVESIGDQFLFEAQKPVHKRDERFCASNTHFPQDMTKRGPRPCIIDRLTLDVHGNGTAHIFPTTELSDCDFRTVMADSFWPILWPSLPECDADRVEELAKTFKKEPFLIGDSPDRPFQRYILVVRSKTDLSLIGKRIPNALVNETQMNRLRHLARSLVLCPDLRQFDEATATAQLQRHDNHVDSSKSKLSSLPNSTLASGVSSYVLHVLMMYAGRPWGSSGLVQRFR